MQKLLPLLALTGGVVLSMPVIAGTPTTSAPALSFHDLEYQMPRDPLLPSDQATGIVEYTPQDQLQSASEALAAAIPAGTPLAEANATLLRAGAHCTAAGLDGERCSYFDVETRDEYSDAVHWNVSLRLKDGAVSAISLDRRWVRS